MKKQTVALLSVALAALCAGSQPARSDDSDIFTQNSIQPNVVILIDSSGSMNDSVGGERKIETAKNAIINLVQSVAGMRYSLFAFNDDSSGAMMIAPVGTDVATMVTEIQSLTATGSTPLGRSSQDILEYFQGTYTEGQQGHGCNDSGGWHNHHGHGNNGSGGSHHFFQWGGSSGGNNNNGGHGGHSSGGWDDNDPDCPIDTYPSPIQYECQKNYYIIITDGLPTGETTNLVADTATLFYTGDLSSTVAGRQYAKVYTIGFDIAAAGTLLQTTAANGGGQYFAATDAASLENSLEAALSAIVADNYTFAAPLIPSTNVSGVNVGYIASFYPGATAFWKGNLKAYDRDATTGMIPVDSTTHEPLASALVWDAGTLLAAKTASSRTIYTETAGTLISFATGTAAITTTLLGVSSSTERTKVIDHTRGIDKYDEDHDDNVTEEREWKLADIFHSTPVMVFPPPLTGIDASYDTFKAANASRTKIILVGSNDGMLHAFRVSDGQEIWSFIPRDVLPKLKTMTPGNYVHAWGIDGSPTVADVKIGSTWKTIVVFGERRGGRSYNALDITDTTAPSFLWSYTDTGMGETWSQPAIGKVAMSGGTFKYVAFVGGGYDTAANNATGKAVYVIDLSNGSKLWKYSNTGSNDSASMNFSIPATPALVDLNLDGNIDRMYIGDVGGQLWKFDVSPLATLTSGVVNNWTGKLVFKAAPTQANPPASGEFYAPQAIYGRPTLAYDNTNALWVYFGTGDRNHPTVTTGQSAIFGIKENTTMANGSALTSSSLVQAPNINTTITQGWYRNLATGEQVLAAAEVHGNVVYVGTFRSTAPTCGMPSSEAKLYAVQMKSGDAAFDWGTGATLNPENSSPPAQVIGAGAVTAPQVVTGGASSTTDNIVVGTSDGQVVATPRPRTVNKNIISWREVQ